MGVAVAEEDEEDVLADEGGRMDREGENVVEEMSVHELNLIAKKNREKFAIKKSYSIEVYTLGFFFISSIVRSFGLLYSRDSYDDLPRKSLNFCNCVSREANRKAGMCREPC